MLYHHQRYISSIEANVLMLSPRHQEFSLFVTECGFTPMEALRSATSLPAKRFNFSDRGQIHEGLRADLLLVEGNPTENIDHTLNIKGVWTKGELCQTYADNFKEQ